MRRMTFAVLAAASAVSLCLFTASVAGAQAPAATISVTGTRDDVVADRRDGHARARPSAGRSTERRCTHNVHGDECELEPALQSPIGIGQAAVDYTFTAPGVYTFLCDVHGAAMSGTVTVEDPGADPLENVLVFSEDGRLPPRLDPRGHRGDPGARRGERLRGRRDRGLRRRSRPPTSPSTTPSSSSPRPATSSTTSSRTRSRATCAPAAATSASTPRPTPSTRGRGTARCSAATSATTRPARPPRPSTSRTPTSPLRRDFRPTGARTDEWYNYQSFETPSVNGGGDDYSVRDSGVKVLATMDESTYNEDDGSEGNNDDHPIAWCSDFDGGHVWYTGLGHTRSRSAPARATSARTSSAACETVTGAEPSDCGEPRQATPAAQRLRAWSRSTTTPRARWSSPSPTTAASSTSSASPASCNVYNPANGQVTTAIQIPVSSVQENGADGHRARPELRRQPLPLRHVHAAAEHRTT